MLKKICPKVLFICWGLGARRHPRSFCAHCPKVKVILYISQSVSSAWTHLLVWCLHCSSLSLSKVIAEKLLVTFPDRKWPRRHEEGWLVTIFRFRVSSLPVTRRLSVSNVFRPKDAPINFLPFTYNGEVAKLTWAWVTDIKTPRHIFHRCCYGYQLSKMPRRSVSCVAMTSIQTFSEVGSLEMTWPWVTWV